MTIIFFQSIIYFTKCDSNLMLLTRKTEANNIWGTDKMYLENTQSWEVYRVALFANWIVAPQCKIYCSWKGTAWIPLKYLLQVNSYKPLLSLGIFSNCHMGIHTLGGRNGRIGVRHSVDPGTKHVFELTPLGWTIKIPKCWESWWYSDPTWLKTKQNKTRENNKITTSQN